MARLLATLTLTALIAAGCGGSSDDDKGSKRTVSAAPNGTLKVSAKEYSFDVGTINLKGAGRLTIELDNKGSLAHDLRIERDGKDIGGTPSFPSGESRKATVNLTHGSYTFLCTVGDHAELGMKGTLVVK